LVRSLWSAIITTRRQKAGALPGRCRVGLETGHTPALTRLMCLEGADEASYQKAEQHLEETGGIHVSARQIQRMVHGWGQPPKLARTRSPARRRRRADYVCERGRHGVPMRKEELAGELATTGWHRQNPHGLPWVCLHQHKTDEEGHPVRDYESTTYVSSFGPSKSLVPVCGRTPFAVAWRWRCRWCC